LGAAARALRRDKALGYWKLTNLMTTWAAEAQMAETVVRLIGALIQAAFELLVQHTGKKALSLWGRKSNPFIELLVGLVVWSVAGLLLVAITAALAAKP